MIEIESETFEVTYHDWGVQTLPIPEQVLIKVDEEYKKTLAEKEEEERDLRQPRRRSSVDNDDISQSVSDTIKRYLRMARKKVLILTRRTGLNALITIAICAILKQRVKSQNRATMMA